MRYLGVPLSEKIYMLGDNESVVNTSMTSHGKFHERHSALSFHSACEVIAAKIVSYHHISSEDNHTDMISKHWTHCKVQSMLKSLLFWKGDAVECLGKDDE